MDRDDGVGGGPWRTLGEEHEEGEGEAEDRQKIEGILDGEKIGEFGIAKAQGIFVSFFLFSGDDSLRKTLGCFVWLLIQGRALCVIYIGTNRSIGAGARRGQI